MSAKRSRRTIIALFSDEEPPLKSVSKKTKNSEGLVWLDRINKKIVKRLKIKNHFNNSKKQFLALWPKSFDREALVKITPEVINRTKYAKNFIVEKNLAPHLIIVFLGVVVALCNVIVARGAGDLYKLIPADPSSQVEISSSIDKYTRLISNDSGSVEKLVSLPTDSGNDGFALNVRTVSTQVSERSDEQPPAAAGPRDNTIKYTVQGGDTLSGLGMKFNVRVVSIKYVNSMTDADYIRPGDVLKIPPEGYEPSAYQIALQEKKLAANTRTTASTSNTGSKITVSAKAGSKYNGYPYGYCTYYVATRRSVPTSWGNAGHWLSSAKRAGYSTGNTPVPGAIMVSSESWWGHVGYVESVSGNTFTISEMNYNGWGVVNRRTLSINAGVIKGFVY